MREELRTEFQNPGLKKMSFRKRVTMYRVCFSPRAVVSSLIRLFTCNSYRTKLEGLLFQRAACKEPIHFTSIQSINQSTERSKGESIKRTINQSINQTYEQPIDQSINQWDWITSVIMVTRSLRCASSETTFTNSCTKNVPSLMWRRDRWPVKQGKKEKSCRMKSATSSCSFFSPALIFDVFYPQKLKKKMKFFFYF